MIKVFTCAFDLIFDATDKYKASVSGLKSHSTILEKLFFAIGIGVTLLKASTKTFLGGFHPEVSHSRLPSLHVPQSTTYNTGFPNGGPVNSTIADTLAKPTKVTSKFGSDRTFNRTASEIAQGKTKHQGVDLKASFGDSVLAPFNGIVKQVNDSTSSKGGRSIKISTEDGKYLLYYAHLSKITVSTGSRVTKGTKVGEVGGSGNGKENAYKPHLHLQVGKFTGNTFTWIDPERYFSSSVVVPVVNTDSLIKENSGSAGMVKRYQSFNPGNYKGKEFSNGKRDILGPRGHAMFDSWELGYAGCAYQLLRYMGGNTSYMQRNPTMAQICRTWVGPHITHTQISQRATTAGVLDINARIPIKFDYVLNILLSICKWDSGHCSYSEGTAGLRLAWDRWISEGNKSDETSENKYDVVSNNFRSSTVSARSTTYNKLSSRRQ